MDRGGTCRGAGGVSGSRSCGFGFGRGSVGRGSGGRGEVGG